MLSRRIESCPEELWVFKLAQCEKAVALRLKTQYNLIKRSIMRGELCYVLRNR